MRLDVLIENRADDDANLPGEHGLSVLVRAHGRQVLFDTGASGNAVTNADALGLGEALAQLDAIVVSHGHYDHAGGLAAVLDHVRRPVPVHVRPGVFEPRLSLRAEAPRAIGVPVDRPSLEAMGAQLVQEAESREILPGFWLTGEIPMRGELDAGEDGLMLAAAPDHAVPDTFTDEQALAVATGRGLAVFVGCSHRGLVNSVLAAKAAAQEEKVAIVFGGAHLRSATADHIDWTIHETQALASQVALGHCTGRPAENRFADALGNRFRRLETGWRWRGR